MKFFKQIFNVRETNDSLIRVIGAALCTAIPMIIGYFSGNMSIGTFGAIGAFVFLSYENIPLAKLMQKYIFIALAMLAGCFLGMMATFVPWTIPLLLALVSMAGTLVFRILNVPSPGAFFIVMVTAMGTGMHPDAKQIPTDILFVALGALVSLLVGLSVAWIIQNLGNQPPKQNKLTVQDHIFHTLKNDNDLLISTLHVGMTMFLASYIGQSIGIGNPYWIVISCFAVLQPRELKSVFTRNLQRIMGTFIGLGIGGLILSLQLELKYTIVVIIILNLLIEYCMVRNYAIANFFTTPMALMLSNLSRGQFIQDLVKYRLLGVLIGSIIAVLGVWAYTMAMRFYHREEYSLDNISS